MFHLGSLGGNLKKPPDYGIMGLLPPWDNNSKQVYSGGASEAYYGLPYLDRTSTR